MRDERHALVGRDACRSASSAALGSVCSTACLGPNSPTQAGNLKTHPCTGLFVCPHFGMRWWQGLQGGGVTRSTDAHLLLLLLLHSMPFPTRQAHRSSAMTKLTS